MRVAPFRALRYRPEVAGPPVQTSAPPYSDLDRFDYASHRTTNPYTVLELMTAEAGVTNADRYAGARTTLHRWLRTGVIGCDDQPAMAVYEQDDPMTGHVQEGLMATADLADFDRGSLLVHEHVDPQRTLLRAARLVQVPVDLTPVVAVHLGAPDPVRQAISAARMDPPTIAFTDETDVIHRVWMIRDPGALAAITDGLADVPAVLADGHHRIAAARQVAVERGVGPSTGPHGFGGTLALVLDAGHHGPQLRAIHRLIRASRPDLPARLAEIDHIAMVPWTGSVAALANELGRTGQRRLGLVTATGCWLATLPTDFGRRLLAELEVPTALCGVDMVALRHVIYPVLGVYDDEPVADVAAAVAQVDDRSADGLVLLASPTVAQVMEVARSGQQMPAKTTWFWPKPRAGLIMRRIDEE